MYIVSCILFTMYSIQNTVLTSLTFPVHKTTIEVVGVSKTQTVHYPACLNVAAINIYTFAIHCQGMYTVYCKTYTVYNVQFTIYKIQLTIYKIQP